MKTFFFLFLLSTAALANTCLSSASGNWNDASKWTACGGGIPVDGDTAKIGQGNTITIPAGYHATIGVSGVGGSQQANSGPVAAIGCNGAPVGSTPYGANGNGILVVNGWLTFRGNVEQCVAVWNVGPDAILEHDSSLAASPSTTHYRWIIGAYLFPDTARLVIRGTVGHRAIVRNAAGSGTFYGFDAYYGSGQGSGQHDFQYVTIDGCGGTTPCTNAASHAATIAFLARCDHCLVTNSGYFSAGTGGNGTRGPLNVISITNSTFTSSADPNGFVVRPVFYGDSSVTLDTIFTNGVIVLAGNNGDNATGTHVRNIVQQANVHRDSIVVGAGFRIAEFDRILRITDQLGGGSSSSYTDVPGGNSTRLMCLMNSNGNPLCFLGPLGIAGQDDSIDGAYLEKIGTGMDGDFILGANLPATYTTIKNVVFPCSTTDGYSGSLSSQVTSSTKKFRLLNNTYCGKDNGSDARGFGYETAGNPQADFLDAARNNIVFCATNVPCYLVHKGPTGTDIAGTYQNVDYNWRWNVATGPYLFSPVWASGTAYVVGNRVRYSDGNSYVSIQNGTNKQPDTQTAYWTVSNEYSPNPPGAHDSSGDPEFVQQRHFLDWGQMLKPSISTWSDIVAEFAKMNDDVGYDSRFTVENAYNWLRDGYRPRNPAVMTAGDTGNRVGAMDATSSQNQTYLVGDVSPYSSDTAPNFGDGVIDSADLTQVLFAVNNVPGFLPVACSDRFDAMDLYPVDTGSTRGGDGVLDVRDLVREWLRARNQDLDRPVRPSRGGACATITGAAATQQHARFSLRPPAGGKGRIELGVPEFSTKVEHWFPVYLEAESDLVRVVVTFALGDQRSKLRFQATSDMPPSLAYDGRLGVVALAWLEGVSLRGGERLLLGYLLGPVGASANLQVFGASASGSDGDRDVLLDSSAVSETEGSKHPSYQRERAKRGFKR